MTYANELNETHWIILRPILEKLEGLPEGDVLFLSYHSPSYTNRVRQVFYNWRYLENKAHLYKVRRLSPTMLSIQKFEHEEPRMITSKLKPHEEFVIDNLLGVTNEKEALACIQDSSLTPQEKVDCVLEWRRIQKD
jgi:hypothetical protein